MVNFFLAVNILVGVTTLVMIFLFRPKTKEGEENSKLINIVDEVQKIMGRFELGFKEEFRLNREEIHATSKESRNELNTSLKDFKLELTEGLKTITDQNTTVLNEVNITLDKRIQQLAENLKNINIEIKAELEKSLRNVQENFDKNIGLFNNLQKEKFEQVTLNQAKLVESNEQKLNLLRGIVDLNLKELKKELTETLRTIIDQNVANLKEVNNTLDVKLLLLAKKSNDNSIELRSELEKSLLGVQKNFDRNVELFNKLQKEKFELLENKQTKLIETTEKKLEMMRETVDEKLQKTLNERLGQSFETVGKQLQAVQAGLGEMRTLASDVGGLKKVLGNVKMRGGIGEMQLSMLLDQILAPEQYAANVKIKPNSSDVVEFAIKLPGKEEGLDQVWLPIDAKFPKDYYEQLQAANDLGDSSQIEFAQKNLENAVKKMAKDISEKYIDPPYTTDFGIMFLPFEGIYAEVVRKSSLLEYIQTNYKIIITGPTTLAAILNSLQMGFKTLAIQRSSGEVWKILAAVKTEFDKFGGLIERVHKNIQTGLDDLDTLAGTRTNVIRRKLKSIEALPESDAKLILPEADASL